MISGILFVVTGIALCVAAVIALFATVEVYYLSGARAIADDGLRRGRPAPDWSLAGLDGRPVQSPPRERPLQMIVFTDHSLRSFPGVAAGLRELADLAEHPEIVVLTRQPSPLTVPALAGLGLAGLPVVTGSAALYGRYNVRVMPFVIVVDSAGLVRASSLVNEAWQITRLWRLAQAEPGPEELLPDRRLRRRLARAGA